MNFITRAIESLTELRPFLISKGQHEDALITDAVCYELANSVKFLFPYNGKTGMKVSQTVLNMLRVPYPVVAFEYEMEATTKCREGVKGKICPSTKRIALVWRMDKDAPMSTFAQHLHKQHNLGDRKGAIVASLAEVELYPGKMIWVLAPGVGFVEINSEVRMVNIADEKEKVAEYEVSLFMILPLLVKSYVQQLGGYKEAQDAIINDISDEVTVSVTGLAALNARNIHHVTVDAPLAQNKKRKKNNRVPFFEYKVLDIFLGHDRTVRHKERERLSATLRIASPRKLGTVMGHFKHRKSGIWWWNDHVRGNKAVGVIEKEYRVKEE